MVKTAKIFLIICFVYVVILFFPSKNRVISKIKLFLLLDYPSKHRFIIAVKSDNPFKVKLMLDSGIDPDISAQFGLGKSETTALIYCAQKGYIDILKVLVENGDNVNIASNYGSPLMLAAVYAHFDMVKYLIEKGADVNAKMSFYGVTPLFCACECRDHKSSYEITRLLLSLGADPNVKAKRRVCETPLAMASFNNHEKTVALLIKAGADVKNDPGCADGESVLMMEVFSANINNVRLLLDNGADVNFVSHFGKTALDYAIEKHYAKLVDLLRKHGAKTAKELGEKK